VGPECARKAVSVIEEAKQTALQHDRERYRNEVTNLGFTIE
jgi:hypothetical protein